MNARDSLIELLAIVNHTQRLTAISRLPTDKREGPHGAERERIYRSDLAQKLARAITDRPDWPRLYAPPARDEVRMYRGLMEERSCEIVMMTATQFQALNQLVSHLLDEAERRAADFPV